MTQDDFIPDDGFEADGAEAAAQVLPGGVGGLDERGKIKRGNVTDEQMLEILYAQAGDTARNPGGPQGPNDELAKEIARLEKKLGRPAKFSRGLPMPTATPARPRASQADVRSVENNMPEMGWGPQQTARAVAWLKSKGINEKHFERALPFVMDVMRMGPLGLATGSARLGTEGYDAATYELGGKVTDVMTNAGFEPEDAALAGYGTNVLAQLPLAMVGSSKPATQAMRHGQKVAERAALAADDPARAAAVKELAKRTAAKDVLLTPGQVTGEASMLETQARRASPRVFERADKAVGQAADDMLYGLTTPEAQMSRLDIGNKILETAKGTVAATKERLRPVFQAADDLDVKVDLSEFRRIASKRLLDDIRTPVSALDASERTLLEETFEKLRRNPNVTPEYVLDSLSALKEKARNATATYKPTEAFTTTVNQMVQAGERAYDAAAKAAGKPELYRDLVRARRQYGAMMDTVYEGAVQKALRREATPEDIVKSLWASGNVSEIKNMDKLLALAQKEGKLSAAGAQKVRADVTRDFLQHAVKDADSAATWSQRLKSSPELRDTWDALTRRPGGKELNDAMKIVEQAAQLAAKNNVSMSGMPILLNQGATETFARRAVSGSQKPALFFGLASWTGITKALATAYTSGDRGMLNKISKFLRAAQQPATNAGALATVRALRPEIDGWAKENGIDDFFIEEESPKAE